MSNATKLAVLSIVLTAASFSLNAFPETTGDSPVLAPIARGVQPSR